MDRTENTGIQLMIDCFLLSTDVQAAMKINAGARYKADRSRIEPALLGTVGRRDGDRHL